MKILVLHGPNLNALGRREPEIYGQETLHQLDGHLSVLARELGVEILPFQSNSEGALIDALYVHAGEIAGIIVNPAGLTTTSVSLRDALAAVGLPTIEVHLSNIHKREGWRQRSLIAPVALGQISGFGWRSYAAALRVLVETLRERGVQ